MRLSAKERFLDAIGSALAGRGIARGDVDSVEFQTGRNFSAHVTLLNGEKLYAKQLRGADCEQRLLRTVRFNSWFAESTPGFSSPSLLGHDYDSRTVIYEYVPSSQKLEEEISTSRVEMSTLQEVAKVLAEFHGASIHNHDDFDKSLPNYPPAGMAAIPMGYFENATMGELDLWRLVQGDGDLQQSLHSLVTEDSPRTLIHGDFRSDQVLLHGDGISLIDWEEFRLGDPRGT